MTDFIKFAVALAPAKDMMAFRRDVVGWIQGLNNEERLSFEKAIKGTKPATLPPSLKRFRVSAEACSLARSLLTLFQERNRRGQEYNGSSGPAVLSRGSVGEIA